MARIISNGACARSTCWFVTILKLRIIPNFNHVQTSGIVSHGYQLQITLSKANLFDLRVNTPCIIIVLTVVRIRVQILHAAYAFRSVAKRAQRALFSAIALALQHARARSGAHAQYRFKKRALLAPFSSTYIAQDSDV